MSEYSKRIEYKDIPFVVAFKLTTAASLYVICNHLGTTIATFDSGCLKFQNSNRFAKYGSLKMAMKRVSKVLQETENTREFKDVPGLYVCRNTTCLEAYDIYKHTQHGVSERVGHIYSNGELSIQNKLVSLKKYTVHQAIRLAFILTQKPSESFQWPIEHEFEDNNTQQLNP